MILSNRKTNFLEHRELECTASTSTMFGSFSSWERTRFICISHPPQIRLYQPLAICALNSPLARLYQKNKNTPMPHRRDLCDEMSVCFIYFQSIIATAR